MEILIFILATTGYLVLFLTTFTSWLYIPITCLVVRFLLRYAYKPVDLKDRPKWDREAGGTALVLFFALILLHVVGVPLSLIVGVFGPFGLLLIDMWGIALVALFALIFLVSGGAAFSTMMGFDGEIPKTYIITPGSYAWIGIGPVVISVMKVIGTGILFFLMLPIAFAKGFAS